MNPYLEGPGIWSDFHTTILGLIKARLNALMPEQYVASIDQYVWLEEAASDTRRPDGKPDAFVSDHGRDSGGVATLSAPAYVTLPTQTRVSRWVRITDQRRDRVVTVLELLSPANKSGAEQEAYLQKRGNYLATETSLVEFDLLRGGESLPMGSDAPDLRDYYVLVSPSYTRPQAGLWTFGVREPIPVIQVPLSRRDSPVQFDLNPLLHQVYDEGRYAMKIDYTQPPVPALGTEDAEWARQLLSSRPQQQPGASSS
jgi:hypothetical protein